MAVSATSGVLNLAIRSRPGSRSQADRNEADGGGAQDRVSGEGDLGAGGEDADARVAAGARRVDVDGLGEVDLPRERLEPVLRDFTRVGEDRELVPGERRVGEDVADDVAEVGHWRDRCKVSRPVGRSMPGSASCE